MLSESTSFQSLAPILARWSHIGRSGLLPALIEAQEELGWLSRETISEIANGLNVPLSEAYGVADFYAHLYTHPVGKTIVHVCDDVPCYLAGSEKFCEAIEKHLQIRAGETTRDGEFTFEIVSCLGHCDHAPVAMIGNQIHENVAPERVEDLIG